MTIKTIKTASTINIDWETFAFTSYKAPAQESWQCPLPPLVISKDYDEKQAKEKAEKKKAEMELARFVNDAMRANWAEKEEARQALIEAKLAEEEAAKSRLDGSQPKVEVVEEKKTFKHYNNGGFHKKPQKKVREVESHHNEARRAKKNEKKVLDKARADRKSTRLNSSHVSESRMPSSA